MGIFRKYPKTKYDFELIRSNRKTISIEIKPDGNIIVRAPNSMSYEKAASFVNEKSEWIEKSLRKIEDNKNKAFDATKLTNEELNALVKKAKQYIPERVALYADDVGVDYGRITIRAQKTRWGSCSSKGNLNFNCLLMLTSKEVIDSVVVHELCHLKHMNHSKDFYNEVLRVFPDYKEHDKWLKKNGSQILAKLPD